MVVSKPMLNSGSSRQSLPISNGDDEFHESRNNIGRFQVRFDAYLGATWYYNFVRVYVPTRLSLTPQPVKFHAGSDYSKRVNEDTT
jgi:hypothetical protein